MPKEQTDVEGKMELKESGLTELTITVDGKGFIKEDLLGAEKPFLAKINPDGSRTRAKLPAGKYHLLIDKEGYIVQMTPALRITCMAYSNQYCVNVWVGTRWMCL